MGLAEKIDRRAKVVMATTKKNLEKAAIEFEKTLIVVLSEPGTRDNPSKPGEAPHKVDGALVKSVKKYVDTKAGVASVGPTINYAHILARTRPYYDIAINKCRKVLARIIFDFDNTR